MDPESLVILHLAVLCITLEWGLVLEPLPDQTFARARLGEKKTTIKFRSTLFTEHNEGLGGERPRGVSRLYLRLSPWSVSLEGDSRLLSLWLSPSRPRTEHHEAELFIAAMPQPCAVTPGHR